MQERERIRVAKEEKKTPFPWTENPVLRNHKFTNVKREDDRTTRWMRKHWTSPHAADADIGEVLFNCALFRYFGKEGGLAEKVHWVHNQWRPEEVVRTALDVRATGQHCFTSAYCKPHYNAEGEASQGFKVYEKICHRYLTSLWHGRNALTKVAKETRYGFLHSQ